MVFKQEQLHFKSVTLSGAHYQLVTGNTESGFCICILIAIIDHNYGIFSLNWDTMLRALNAIIN